MSVCWGWGWTGAGHVSNDFLGLTFQNSIMNGKPVGPPITGLYVVQNLYEIQTSQSKWIDLAIVFGMVIGYRITFFLMIKFKERVKPVLHSLVSRCRHWSCTGGSSCNNMCKRSCSPLQNPVPPVALASPSPLNDTVPLRHFSDRMNVNIADHQAHESCVKCSSCQVHPKEMVLPSNAHHRETRCIILGNDLLDL
ncbi:unnamed protein product [Sphagnum troendelagicum]|uniref:Uncharacterized protein n=1 Tax=Sphagnum troendelagicum TaxID=128251 RepID=A0ABP0US61_9BRYO